jgi:hypothetical protein
LEKSVAATLDAHFRCEVAVGRARTIGLALSGTAWFPADGKSDTEWLLGTTGNGPK